MRRYVFFYWTLDKADDYNEQYGLTIDEVIFKHSKDCMIFGTKVGEFDDLKEIINYAHKYMNNKNNSGYFGIYDNEERDWIKDW